MLSQGCDKKRPPTQPESPADEITWRRVLKTAEFPEGYTGADKTPSGYVFYVCRGAIRSGYTVEQVEPLLADPSTLGGASYFKPGHGHKWLIEFVWPKAEKSAAQSLAKDQGRIHPQVQAFLDAVNDHRWKGTGGATDRSVLLALGNVAAGRWTLTVGGSYRWISEQTGVTNRTVFSSVTRLRKAGWLRRLSRGHMKMVPDGDDTYTEYPVASVWQLTVPEGCASLRHSGGTSVGVPNGASTHTPPHDVFSYGGGFGPNGARVLNALVPGPLTSRELATALRLHRTTTLRLLPRLADHGLVHALADGRYVLATGEETPTLDHVAKNLDVNGKQAARSEYSRAEREAFVDYRANTADLREAANSERLAALREVEAAKAAEKRRRQEKAEQSAAAAKDVADAKAQGKSVRRVPMLSVAGPIEDQADLWVPPLHPEKAPEPTGTPVYGNYGTATG